MHLRAYDCLTGKLPEYTGVPNKVVGACIFKEDEPDELS